MSDSTRSGLEPIFLVSCERSGSTLLLMLDHHPQMAWAPGPEFAVALVRHWPPPDEFRRYLETNRIFQRRSLTIDKRLGFIKHLL